MPAKSVHRSGNQQATMITLLKRTGGTLPGFFNYFIYYSEKIMMDAIFKEFNGKLNVRNMKEGFSCNLVNSVLIQTKKRSGQWWLL